MMNVYTVIVILSLVCTCIGKDVPLIAVGDYELYEILKLPICSLDDGFGVKCNILYSDDSKDVADACTDVLPKCAPLVDCLGTVCTNQCTVAPDFYCAVKKRVEYVLEQGGLPEIGIPLRETASLLITAVAGLDIEWCDGFKIKCDEHPEGCVDLEELCPRGGYKCYCGLDDTAGYIEYLKTATK
ncbi:uncharacterized protein LOC144453794 [Glandiceps talaboti]